MMITPEQREALGTVARSFGWDKMSDEQFFIMVWAAFHYWVQHRNASTRTNPIPTPPTRYEPSGRGDIFA